MGRELARVDTGEDEPAPERVREAIREIVSHCIYGVDKNPLAVDLCRVALWLENHTADKPLTFLDHRIRPGDSLVGVFDLDVLKEGIPDKAFDPLEGDDKATARELARRNREERGGARNLSRWDAGPFMSDFNRQSRELDAIADDSPGAIHRKKDMYQRERSSPAWQRQKQACDLWTAAFFQPLQPDQPAITTARLAEHLAGNTIDGRLSGIARTFSDLQPFFHWPLEFPEVFADGGFDAILSNPPWERIKLQEQEFFEARDARIAMAPTKAAREKLIKELPRKDPHLHSAFVEALRAASGASASLRHGGRFPLCGRGDINTYAVFAELGANAINPEGRTGLILPTGIATDDTTKLFFGSLVHEGRLVDLIGFENEDFIFPAVHHAFKFCKITIGGVAKPKEESRIGFYIRHFSELSEASRFFSLSMSDFSLLNPNTGNCPIFRTQADAELTKAIYRRVPVLWREASDGQPEVNPWRLTFKALFHMANDSHHFRTEEDLLREGLRREGNVYVGRDVRYLPLYEAKMLHQFDHRFSTYEGATERQLNVGILPQPTAEQKRDPDFVVQPRYWVREDVVESTLPKYPEPLAAALQIGHRLSIQRVLCWWAAGYQSNHGEDEQGRTLLFSAKRFDLDRAVSRAFPDADPETIATSLDRDFPLTKADVAAIGKQLGSPEKLASQLLARFSPKWFLGWRDITNAGNERTTISSALPKASVGDTFLLIFSRSQEAHARAALMSILNSFVQDYGARQKVGGMHMKYNVFRQLAVLAPECLENSAWWDARVRLRAWLLPRLLELVYTANDLVPLAEDCGFDGPPFLWDDERRFEIRCELDAAFFHLYLPADNDGQWRTAEAETPKQLAALKTHFPTPRHAVGFILDQFPLVRQKDEKAHGCYRTKERILEIYDATLAAQRSGKPYESTLNPPPGEGPRAAKA